MNRRQKQALVIGGGFATLVFFMVAADRVRESVREALSKQPLRLGPSDSPAQRVRMGDRAAFRLEPRPDGPPPFPGVPPTATAVLVNVVDVGDRTVSGPIVAFTKQPDPLSALITLGFAGLISTPLRPPSEPLTFLRDRIDYLERDA